MITAMQASWHEQNISLTKSTLPFLVGFYLICIRIMSKTKETKVPLLWGFYTVVIFLVTSKNLQKSDVPKTKILLLLSSLHCSYGKHLYLLILLLLPFSPSQLACWKMQPRHERPRCSRDLIKSSHTDESCRS